MVSVAVTKDDGDSPQSIPSVADTSVGSSHDGSVEEAIATNVARRLFEDEGEELTYDQSILSTAVVENIRKLSEDREAYGSEISITSSETTALATWNLSMQDSSDETVDGSFPNFFEEPNRSDLTTPLRNAKDKSIAEEEWENHATHIRRSPQMIEEPPEEITSCNRALSLTPRQLAEIFVAFQGARKIWPSRSKVSPEPESNETLEERTDWLNEPSAEAAANEVEERIDPLSHREDLLTRECAALKRFLEDDSIKIVNLKRAMEAEREMYSNKEFEVEDKQIELDIALDRIDALKKEKEVMREREEELIETIEILKSEVDKLSTITARREPKYISHDGQALLDANEDASYMGNRATREVDSSNASEETDLVSVLRTTLETTKQETVQLKAQVKYLESELQSNAARSLEPEDNHRGSQAMFSERLSSPELSAVLQSISTRLEAVERERSDTESKSIEVLQQKDTELEKIRGSLNLEEEKINQDVLKISEDPDEIEIVAPKKNQKSVKVKRSGQEKPSCCGCDAWSAISGDLE